MNNGDYSPASYSLRVLVVEDNNDDSDLLVRQLKKNRFEGAVKIIADGREAWNLLSNDPAVQGLIAVFLDLKLPSLSGLALLAKMRATPALESLPVFVMTSSNDPEDLEECTRLGVEGYIAKPVTFSTFSKVVADLFHAPTLKTAGRVE